MTPKQRFAEDHALTDTQVHDLCKRAERVADAETAYANNTRRPREGELGRRVEEQTAAFERLAKDCGFTGVDYPGLYPTVNKGDNKFIQLPLDD